MFNRSAAALFILVVVFCANVFAQTLPNESECRASQGHDEVTSGWCLVIDRRIGNCLACHVIFADPWPEDLPAGGNVAPPLVEMQQRFPDIAVLRAQIWDATVANPNSTMPPFGRHEILTEEEIDLVVKFLLTI